MLIDESIVKKSKEYAVITHASTNHTYDSMPYSHHLDDVFHIGLKFIYIIPKGEQEDVLAALWCHDMIEDCRVTYNDIKGYLNENIAELVYAVTNEKGKNRSERANERYYKGIVDCKHATFVKLCDRIANVEYSLFVCGVNDNRGGMLTKYRKEHQHFMESLKLLSGNAPVQSIYSDMAEYLNKITWKK